jgi:pyruvate kinase
VHAVDLTEEPDDDWRTFVEGWVRAHGIPAGRVMLVAGPSARNPHANHRVELMKLRA